MEANKRKQEIEGERAKVGRKGITHTQTNKLSGGAPPLESESETNKCD